MGSSQGTRSRSSLALRVGAAAAVVPPVAIKAGLGGDGPVKAFGIVPAAMEREDAANAVSSQHAASMHLPGRIAPTPAGQALGAVPCHTTALGSHQVAPKSSRRLYRVATPCLGVRVGPDVNSARTGTVLRRGDLFEASVVAAGADGRIYLKLAGARGWVFDDSAIDTHDPSVEPALLSE